jgi:AraC family transcriptional regulator of adaptative response/methylated-DNA-[protein]-cysteine methyltransferase
MCASRSTADTSRETLSFEFADTSLGRLLVGMSTSGVVWASLGKSKKRLVEEFAARFPGAEIVAGGGARAPWTAAVARHIETPLKPGKRPPLDLRGTQFQREVWDALLAIPAGQTRTYGEIAREIGRPKAVRAVGQACGANPVGYVVPCHRVIGANQALTGYAGGLPTKKKLLEREGAL